MLHSHYSPLSCRGPRLFCADGLGAFHFRRAERADMYYVNQLPIEPLKENSRMCLEGFSTILCTTCSIQKASKNCCKIGHRSLMDGREKRRPRQAALDLLSQGPRSNLDPSCFNLIMFRSHAISTLYSSACWPD